MEITQVVGRTAEGMNARRVFSEPIQQDGVTVVLAASVRGGGGGGERGPSGEAAPGANEGGGGFGFIARPAGAFLIRNGKVSWRPAIDVNRVILGGQLVAISALFLARTIVRARAHARGRFALRRRH